LLLANEEEDRLGVLLALGQQRCGPFDRALSQFDEL
jgi:hypothetical protein